MNRRQRIIHGLVWAAIILWAAVAGADPFFTSVLLPVLASSTFGLTAHSPCRLRAQAKT